MASSQVARRPLFDRLVDEDPFSSEEVVPQRTLTVGELQTSIALELTRLLSTRCPLPADAVLGRPRTLLSYGLPDLEGGRDAEKLTSRRLERLVGETVSAFEPRLRRVVVSIAHIEHGRVTVAIHGALAMESLHRPVSFTIDLGQVGKLDDGR